MQYTVIAAVAVLSYLIGSFNFSIILSRAVSGTDIRESGSGNAGATNMLRTHGKKMAVFTLLLDALKGIAAVLLAMLAASLMRGEALPLGVHNGEAKFIVTDYSELKYIAAVCVVLGHNFPVYFGFKGGKGVATSLGVVMMLDWRMGLIVAVIAIAVMAVTKYVSLGSIVGGALYIVIAGALILIYRPMGWAVKLLCVLILGGLLIFRHRSNIARLIRGEENRLTFSRKEK